MTVPVLTTEQRMAALEKAKQVRKERAEFKKQLKEGNLAITDALEAPIMQRVKTYSLLISLPGVGKAKADEIMEKLSISSRSRIGSLGSKQKAGLIEIFW